MRVRFVVGLGLTIAAASCGGDGVIDMGGTPPPSGAPTLTSLQSSIFTPRCALPSCHAGPTPQQGMDLSAGKTYLATVGVDSLELHSFERVAAAHAADSYLYMKIAGDPRIIGDRMPQGGTLTATEIAAIAAWIDAGAMND